MQNYSKINDKLKIYLDLGYSYETTVSPPCLDEMEFAEIVCKPDKDYKGD